MDVKIYGINPVYENDSLSKVSMSFSVQNADQSFTFSGTISLTNDDLNTVNELFKELADIARQRMIQRLESPAE